MEVDNNYIRALKWRKGEELLLILPIWIVNTLLLLRKDIPIESWSDLVSTSRNGPHPMYHFNLTGSEKQILRKRVNSYTTPTNDFLRAKIILLAETGLGVKVIADILKIDRETVREWCRRFCIWGIEGLKDRPRSGAPRTIPKLQIMAIKSYILHEMALKWKANRMTEGDEEPISQLGEMPPLSRLSARDIHLLLVRDFEEHAPSLNSVYRILKRLRLRPWLFQNWIHVRDPRFWEKGAVVLDLYAGIYFGEKLGEDEYVLSADELTQLQVLERIETSGGPGHLRKVEFEYERHGILNMHAARDVGSGIVHHRFVEGPSSTKEEFREFVRMVMAKEPYASARRVFWVVDNGGCHHPNTFGEWLREEFGGRAVAVHTPAHGSWLNQIEIFFSTLVRKALTPRNSSSQEVMMVKITDFIEYENSKAKPYKWTYTKQKLDALLKRLKEKGLYPPPSGPLDIPDVGPKRRRALLDAFGTVDRIREASYGELIMLPNIGEKTARKIISHLRGE